MNRHEYEALLEQRSDAYSRMSVLNGAAEAGRRDLTAQEASEFDELERQYDRLTREINGAQIDAPSGHPLGGDGRLRRVGDDSCDRSGLNRDQDVALRAIDRRDDVDSASGDRLEKVIRSDRHGIDSRYIAAVSDPAYARAFAKKVLAVDGAEGMLDQEEAEAMRRVADSMSERALAVGEGSTGGYAIPFDLDPTIRITNDGAINPIRELANVVTITNTKWQGVTSAGTGFDFVAEATEAADKSPTLAQPEITPEKAQAFIPFSIEVQQDWDGLSGELAKLLADARNIKEAEVFAVGAGSGHVPQGLVTGATETVTSATKEVFAIADVYSMQQALGARYQPRAVWLGANAVANQIYKFVAAGDTTNARIMSEDRSQLLGKAFYEVSTMSSKTTEASAKVLAYGDIRSAYTIVDRIGMTIEVVQHLFGENRRPTGQRGLYCYFRVGAKVINPGAVRVLKIHT